MKFKSFFFFCHRYSSFFIIIKFKKYQRLRLRKCRFSNYHRFSVSLFSFFLVKDIRLTARSSLLLFTSPFTIFYHNFLLLVQCLLLLYIILCFHHFLKKMWVCFMSLILLKNKLNDLFRSSHTLSQISIICVAVVSFSQYFDLLLPQLLTKNVFTSHSAFPAPVQARADCK